MNVEGKAAIITGGGTGVGRATALQLAERGCSVLVNYSRSVEDAEKTAAEAAAHGVKAIAVQADVSQDAAVRAMTDAAAKEFGRLDILVNNAGATTFVNHADLEKVTDEDWDHILAVNVKGTFFCTRAATPALKASGDGEVVNVSSVAGVAATGSSIPYCASKAAVNNLTIALARVLAPEVRVNAVAPGAIQGRWLKGGLGQAYDQIMDGIASQVPLQATCTPEDVADAITSVITGSDLVTGQILVCDGGMLIR
jgi:3-oxoacyl-[acyl-carrier protein] reductase